MTFERWDDECAICGASFHLSPECVPRPKHSHCTRRGPHVDIGCLFDHSLPGGVYYRNPVTGRSPLDVALAASRALERIEGLPTGFFGMPEAESKP